MSSLKTSTITLLLLMTLALSCWFIVISKQPKALTGDAAHRPDAFMEDVVAVIINKEGNPALKVEAPKMVHYPDQDTTDIETPHLTLYRQTPEPWHINSQYAKATHGLDQIYFWDNVILHHVNDISNPTTTMLTATLTVFPDKEIAQTNDNVTLMQPDTVIHGEGMLANLNNGTVQLLSQARGEYVPHST